jgi:hypothetical protein
MDRKLTDISWSKKIGLRRSQIFAVTKNLQSPIKVVKKVKLIIAVFLNFISYSIILRASLGIGINEPVAMTFMIETLRSAFATVTISASAGVILVETRALTTVILSQTLMLLSLASTRLTAHFADVGLLPLHLFHFCIKACVLFDISPTIDLK